MKKTLIATTLAAALGTAAFPAAARDRGDDRAAGALIGGIAGAAIGSQVDRGGGAIVGGILGALAGASIADSRHDYRDYNYRSRGDQRRYRGAYYAPPSARYGAPYSGSARYDYGYRGGYYRYR